MSIPLRRLGEVATFIRGITFKPDDLISLDADDAVACFRTKNVQDQLDTEDVWAIPSSFVKRQEQYLHEGDLLVSSANSWNLIGKCSWIPELKSPSTLGGFISCLRAKPDFICTRYLYHWFRNPEVQTDVRNCGRQTTNISNLDLERCLKLQIPLPPMEEQRRIATILDQAEVLRTKRHQTLAKLDTLTQSLFLEMFGNTVKDLLVPLDELIVDGPQNGLYRPASDYGSGTPILRIDAFYDGEISDLSALKRLRIPDSEIARYRLLENDIIINRVNSLDYLGKTALVRGLMEPTVFESNMMRLHLNEQRIDSTYAIQALQAKSVRAQILSRAKKAVNQASINQEDVRSIQIPVPALEDQIRFSEVVKSISFQAAKAQYVQKKIEQLFVGLQDSAFKGDL
jgi:type I restriction enzyme S subunit